MGTFSFHFVITLALWTLGGSPAARVGPGPVCLSAGSLCCFPSGLSSRFGVRTCPSFQNSHSPARRAAFSRRGAQALGVSLLPAPSSRWPRCSACCSWDLSAPPALSASPFSASLLEFTLQSLAQHCLFQEALWAPGSLVLGSPCLILRSCSALYLLLAPPIAP